MHVVVGSFTPSVVLDLARTSGRLAAHDLEVEEVPVTSSPSQFGALVDGSLHVALTSPDNVLAYRFSPGNPLGGLLDATIVGAVDRGLGLGLYGAPGVGVDDLRGARLGVDVPVSGFALAMYELAQGLGLPRDAYDVQALGSTPQRLRALLDGACPATMLNAGNELAAEAAGCVRLATVAGTGRPYLGTVVAVVGPTHLDAARRLAAALADTSYAVLAGALDDEAAEAAARRLGLDDGLAHRYLRRLQDPLDGLVAGGEVDPAALETLVAWRQRHLPQVVDGRDVLAGALEPGSGLVTPR